MASNWWTHMSYTLLIVVQHASTVPTPFCEVHTPVTSVLTSSLNLKSPCPGTVPASPLSSPVELSGFSSVFPLHSPRAVGDSRDRKLAAYRSRPPWVMGIGPCTCHGVCFPCWRTPLQHATRLSVPLSLARYEPLTWGRFNLANSVTGVYLSRHDTGSSRHTGALRADTRQRTFVLRHSGAEIPRKHSVIIFTRLTLPTCWPRAVSPRVHHEVKEPRWSEPTGTLIEPAGCHVAVNRYGTWCRKTYFPSALLI